MNCKDSRGSCREIANKARTLIGGDMKINTETIHEDRVYAVLSQGDLEDICSKLDGE